MLASALFWCCCVAAVSRNSFAQARPAPAQPNPGLEAVLTQMDSAAAQFRNAQADFVWDQYQKVVNETDTQKGKIYFRRNGKEMQMADDIQSPEQKYVLFSGGKIRLYQPKINQVNEYDAGQNRGEIESFLVLGFGGRGHDLQQQFDVKFDGYEDVNGIKTAKLELTPKLARVKNMFQKIVIWVDPQRGVSVQQQAFEPSGDYRIARYNNIMINTKIPDDVFKLHTSGRTKTVKGP
jgi:outer membrane lipoprotein-sorting protein